MLTCKFIGNLGNQLFELWSLIGLGKKHNQMVQFPESEMYQYFEGNFFIDLKMLDSESVAEREFTHHEWPINDDVHYTIHGYRQSEKYWQHCEKELRKKFWFKPSFYYHVTNKVPFILADKKTICISIRRGDFVGNKTYYQLPAKYYIGALIEHFPNYEDYNIVVLSDDIEYCKVHFECLPNVFFAEGMTAMEQLCLGSMCDHHIISNSTFSWWCAYLSDNTAYGTGKVIRPKFNFGEEYRAKNPEHDYWPDRKNWIVFDHEDYKIDLKDCTFMIPVFHDHMDRKGNLDLSVCMLQRDFHTDITVMEYVKNSGRIYYNYFTQFGCQYMQIHGNQYFHRTKMLNQMAWQAKTPIVVNWDADVFLPPLALYMAVRAIRRGETDFAYPYDGRFARVVRDPWYKELCTALDVGIFQGREKFGPKGRDMATTSVGGAIVMSRHAFIDSGMENEHMISYAPEDCERWDRWHKLGFGVMRVPARLYHMDHFISLDSCSQNPYFKANHKEYDKIHDMTQEDLIKYVATWPWHQQNSVPS